jgi:hypothetical protein
VDESLPVWAQPHRFYLLDQRQRDVFTFGLVLTELRALRRVEGVRSFGRRFGFEWLPSLARGVRCEHERVGRRAESSMREFPAGELETFLFEKHGFRCPREFDLKRWAAAQKEPAGEPPDEALRTFARTDGAQIASWSLNAFNMIEVNLFEWARARERVPAGYALVARSRLKLTKMLHTLESVTDLDGRERWAHGYRSLHERVALELEDLAIRRPKPRICPLCRRVYIPLRPKQSICSTQIWEATSRRLVGRCTPRSESALWDAAEADDYRRRRKTRWTAMNRVRKRHGQNHPRTAQAIAEWEAWRRQNPPPRPPGRPLKPEPAGAEPPFHPGTDPG